MAVTAEMEEREASVKRQTDVVASVVTLINDGIAQRIIDAGNDPLKLKALSDELTWFQKILVCPRPWAR